MKTKNCLQALLILTLTSSVFVNAAQVNLDQLRNLEKDVNQSEKNYTIKQGAAIAAGTLTGAAALGLGSFLYIKQNDKLNKANRTVGELQENKNKLSDEAAELRKNLEYVSEQLSGAQEKNEKALEDFVRVEAQRRELTTENESLAEQLNKILPIPEMQEAVRNLRVELGQDDKDYREAIAPLQKKVADLDRQITLKEEASAKLQGHWLSNAKEEENKLIEQRDFIVDDLRAREQGYYGEIDIYTNYALQNFIKKYPSPGVREVFIEELALAELQDGVEISG